MLGASDRYIVAGDWVSGLRGPVVRGKPLKYKVTLPETVNGFLTVTSPLKIELPDGTIVPVPLQDDPWPATIQFGSRQFGDAPAEKRPVIAGKSTLPGAKAFEERIVFTGASTVPWPASSTHVSNIRL